MTQADMSGTRRKLLGLVGGALAAFGIAGAARAAEQAAEAAGKGGQSSGHHGDHKRHRKEMHGILARQQIMELRHNYGLATDLIGSNTAEGIAAGRAIYHRIFTADASIGASGQNTVTGPDAWVDIVKNALAPYNATQHLIGTQNITALTLPDRSGAGGSAQMTSYLQAWHSKADGYLWLFMGTYTDELTYTPEKGWQIKAMVLRQTAADYRKLGVQPA